jgi:hypothetical protein
MRVSRLLLLVLLQLLLYLGHLLLKELLLLLKELLLVCYGHLLVSDGHVKLCCTVAASTITGDAAARGSQWAVMSCCQALVEEWLDRFVTPSSHCFSSRQPWPANITAAADWTMKELLAADRQTSSSTK